MQKLTYNKYIQNDINCKKIAQKKENFNFFHLTHFSNIPAVNEPTKYPHPRATTTGEMSSINNLRLLANVGMDTPSEDIANP